MMHKSLEALLSHGIENRIYSAASASYNTPNSAHSAAVSTEIETGHSSQTTHFDIASLTKLFTASACLRLIDRGILDLDAPISLYLEALFAKPSGQARLEDLLRHQAGFPPWRPFFEDAAPRIRGTRAGHEAIRTSVLATSPTTLPGTRVQYTDIGFIILGYLLEKVVDSPLDAIIAQEVTIPLGLDTVHFRPLNDPAIPQTLTIAPTENCPWRGYSLRGEVHDDNAWSMGGVAGHAGLFATADDIAAFGKAWSDALDGHGWIAAPLARQAVMPHSSGRGLGFDFKSKPASSAGTLMSDTSFGHLGFTGCSLWVDPVRRLSVALLTNRVCYGRDNHKIQTYRPYFHDWVISNIKERND